MTLIGSPETIANRNATYVIERRGGFPWSDESCFYCCNHDRPLPAELPNHAQPIHLPLYIWKEVQAAQITSSQLRIVLWAADPEDQISVWMGSTLLRELDRDLSVKDSQIYGGNPQLPAGSVPAYYIEDPDQQLLQVTFDLPAANLITGENRVSIATGTRAPYRPSMYGTRIVVEKVEVDLFYQ